LSVPIPPPDEKTEEVVQLNAQEVYDEGRSVGFQEGMINAMNLINTELVRIQTELREQIKKDAEAKK
jgi:hypothetical protein